MERVIPVATWIAAGQGFWLAFRLLTGTVGSIDRLVPISTAAAQAVLALAATALLIVTDRPWRCWRLAIIGCLPLFAVGFPEVIWWPPNGAAAYLPLALFVVFNTATYYAIVLRQGLNLEELSRYAVGVLQWTAAAVLAWVIALFGAGVLDTVPRFLPLAIAIVQIALVLLLPIGLMIWSGRLSPPSIVYDPARRNDPSTQIEVIRGRREGKRSAWIMADRGLPDDSRVIRLVRALIDAGWGVVMFGFDGRSQQPEDWTYIRLPSSDGFRGVPRQILRLARGTGWLLTVICWPKTLRRWTALVYHWCDPEWLHIRKSLLRVAHNNPDLKPDLVIANASFTRDLGHSLAPSFSAKFIVDFNEYPVEQRARDPKWTRWTRRCVAAIQAHCLAQADLVTTVSSGISELLNADHKLRRPALVVRSVPIKQPLPFRPTGERIKVLYDGVLWHPRQLHTAIQSMPMWRAEFDLILRGDGDPAYIAELRRIVKRHGLDHRVFFECAAASDNIIPLTSQADIGYLSYASFSRESEYALPGSFLEYLTAGLALCVIDLIEIGRLVRQYGLGKLISCHTPEAIAQTINSFTRDEIDRCKEASFTAAEMLGWDHEKAIMLGAYDHLFDVPSTCARPEA
jgi:glycosyltransferase involved in cell wall biosynthesis